MLTYQYKLFASKSQVRLFKKQLNIHKSLYNICLEQKINSYKTTGKSPTCFDQIKSEIPKLKGLSNYSSMQQTVRRLDKSYQFFFKQQNSFPRFKSQFKTIEFAKIGDGCKIHDNYIYIQYIGNIKIKKHRPLPTDYKIKTLSITYKNNQLYVNIILDKIIAVAPQRSTSVGIDFGIQNTITTSNNEQFITPKFTKLQSKNLARLQRKKEKGIINKQNIQRIKRAITKIHTKISNQRKDFNHKLSKQIVLQYDIICLEDLKINSILTNISNINKRILDIAINQLVQFITYKAENAGKLVIKVNPAYTTQTCNQCKTIQNIDIMERIYNCKYCNISVNRDVNAALNILSLGLQTLAKA